MRPKRPNTAVLSNRSKQLGMSKWGWLLFIVVAVAALSAVLRVGPHYIDYRIVQGVADRLPVGEVHAQMSRQEIKEHFQKQFRIENFKVPVNDMLVIERDRAQTLVNINYEIREHLFYNIDVVLVFGEQRVFK